MKTIVIVIEAIALELLICKRQGMLLHMHTK